MLTGVVQLMDWTETFGGGGLNIRKWLGVAQINRWSTVQPTSHDFKAPIHCQMGSRI
jgi:hypothetical protein